MRSVIKGFLLLGLLLLLPFGYLYYRDVIVRGDISTLDTCTPYNVEWEVKKAEVELKWKTRDKCVGYVRYGGDTESLNSIGVDTEGSVKKREHIVILENLNKGEDYYVVFYSGDVTYGHSGQPLVVRID